MFQIFHGRFLVDVFVNFMADASMSVNLSFLYLFVRSSIMRYGVWYLVGIWVYGGCSGVMGDGWSNLGGRVSQAWGRRVGLG